MNGAEVMDTCEDLRQQIKGHCSNGSFFSVLRGSWRQSDAFVDCAVDLHNARQINLLDCISEMDGSKIEGPDFFMGVQGFYNKAVPKIKCEVDDILVAIRKLVRLGGQDMAATEPNGALLEWCKANTDKSELIVSKALAGDELSISYLGIALQALKDLKRAQDIATSYDDHRRLMALDAMSRLPHAQAEMDNSLTALESILKHSTPDDVCARVLDVATFLCTLEGSDASRVMKVAKSALRDAGSIVLYAAAKALLSRKLKENTEIYIVMLAGLRRTPSSDMGTIRLIDAALSAAPSPPLEQITLEFIHDVVTRVDDSIGLDVFKSTMHSIIDRNSPTFHRHMAHWLLDGNASLCAGLAAAIRESADAKIIDLDIEPLGLSNKQLYLLSRRAIGYLFMQPLTAASVVLSALKVADDDCARAIAQIFVDPLCVNFTGTLRDYLSKLQAANPEADRIADISREVDRYTDGLGAAGQLKELRPSEHRRQLERERLTDEMRQSMRQAEEDSVLLKLVKRSLILHGHRSLIYVEGAGKHRSPVSTELTPHTVAFEWPRQETIDPIGLDFLLRSLRACLRRATAIA